jgi:hypothetical protein
MICSHSKAVQVHRRRDGKRCCSCPSRRSNRTSNSTGWRTLGLGPFRLLLMDSSLQRPAGCRSILLFSSWCSSTMGSTKYSQRQSTTINGTGACRFLTVATLQCTMYVAICYTRQAMQTVWSESLDLLIWLASCIYFDNPHPLEEY